MDALAFLFVFAKEISRFATQLTKNPQFNCKVPNHLG